MVDFILGLVLKVVLKHLRCHLVCSELEGVLRVLKVLERLLVGKEQRIVAVEHERLRLRIV
jgi:hypothetical protein